MYCCLMCSLYGQLPDVSQPNGVVLPHLGAMSASFDISFPAADQGGDTTLSYTQAASLANSLPGVTVTEMQSAALGQSQLPG